MSKNFNKFLNTFTDEQLMQTSSQYFPRKSYSDDEEKIINMSLALSKGLLRDYHEWLINNFDISPKN